MRIEIPVLLAILAASCVKGSPDDGDDTDLVTDGGRYTVPGCGYDIVTIAGAEAPAPGAATLGAAATPFQVHLGFGGDPTTSMAILWRTDLDTPITQVRYGVADALDQTAEGVTYVYVAGIGGDEVRIHEAHLCGLSPDTVYSYQVGGATEAGESWSPARTFRTAPTAPDAEVRIAVVGDSRGGYDVWGRIAADIHAQAVDLVMYSGDAVTIGQIQHEWDSFFDAAPDLLATVPILSAHGNHDLNSVNYFSQFAMPGDESNYSFDYGAVHMTVLNDTPKQIGDLTGSIQAFLDRDLRAATRPWKIVNHHRPLWSSGTRHGSDETLRVQWGAVIDEHHADLVIAGHDHIYERTRPMFGDQVVASPAEGTIYLVSGGAGAGLYGVVDPVPYFSQYAESTHSYAILSVRAAMLQAEMFRPGQTTPFDTFTITK